MILISARIESQDCIEKKRIATAQYCKKAMEFGALQLCYAKSSLKVIENPLKSIENH